MEFKQFYLPCLAHASYLVGDKAAGSCAIVDPQRDVDHYLEEAAARGLKIVAVIETHLHADFVSGHVELAARTGARVYVGHAAGATFAHVAVREGDEIPLGSLRLRFLESPGHTPEGVCVLVLEGGRPLKLLSGDTLFIGDVGRPDLAGGRGYTSEQMAGLMYDTLHGKILPLPDEVEVYPAHGAGSACGKNISDALSSTIAEQRATNWALQPMSRAQFVSALTADLGAPPAYFPHDAEMNRRGAPALAELPKPQALSAPPPGALVLDVRPAADFARAHVAGALSIGLGGSFASWCGSLLPAEQPLFLVAGSEAEVAEAVMRLARVGLHRVAGFLQGGMRDWKGATASLPQISPQELERTADLQRLDVRRVPEHQRAHVPEALNVPLHELEARLGELDRSRPLAVVCQTGYRSTTACSLLERAGFRDLRNVTGGTQAWIEAGLPVA